MNRKILSKIIIGIIIFFSILGSAYVYLRSSGRDLLEQPRPQSKEMKSQKDQINTDKKIIVQTVKGEAYSDIGDRDISTFDPITKQVQLLLHGPYEAQGVFQKHLIVKNKETNKFFEYDIATKSLVMSNFPDEKHWSDQRYQFISLSKTFVGEERMLIVRYSYNTNTVGEGDSGAGLPTEKFIYSFANNSFTSAKSFIQKGAELLPESRSYDFFGISSDGNKMFFNKNLGLQGCVNVAVTDLIKESSWKMLEEETNVNQSSPIDCPWFNDSGTRLIYRSKKDDGTMLQLTSTEDPTSPIKSILLPKSLIMRLNDSENAFSQERTASWIDDNRVIISFDRGMALADFNNETVKEIYFDNTIDIGYTAWDFYNFSSDDGKYVALIDWDNSNPIPCSANSKRMCPGENSHSIRRVIVIDIESGEKITVGDNLMFVDWIKL